MQPADVPNWLADGVRKNLMLWGSGSSLGTTLPSGSRMELPSGREPWETGALINSSIRAGGRQLVAVSKGRKCRPCVSHDSRQTLPELSRRTISGGSNASHHRSCRVCCLQLGWFHCFVQQNFINGRHSFYIRSTCCLRAL